VRRRVAAGVLALLAGGCGGGGGSSSPTTPATATPAVPSKVVVLDSGNFETLVLTSARPSLVEFYSPT
jgi:hypothetical protein